MDKEVKREDKKLRLVVEGQESTSHPKLNKLHFSTNGKKPHKRGKNTYRRRLNKFRRSLRW